MTDCGQLWTRVDSCWVEMADAVRRGDSSKSLHDCGADAGELVQLATFALICRRNRIFPRVTTTETFDEILEFLRERFGHMLFQTHADCSGGLDISVDSSAWQKMVSRLESIEGPPEILAHIHQRMLGRRLADNGQGGLRSLPENSGKKAGGVFYTPDYVARYMVEQALSWANRGMPTILDPACGCGAFLLAAFR
ncbi:MAG: N-6 DNA methylase, partial [Planctomycetota bacterium]|nr:N-6 DNA methylase [Planctomycetota bacterium]